MSPDEIYLVFEFLELDLGKKIANPKIWLALFSATS
jgi:hypothetical protein